MTSPPDDTTADTSAIMAALRTERDAALAREAALAEALAQRNSEYGERIEQQSATIDVLKVMSASPGEPEPVFEVIVRRARDLCDAYSASLARVVDGSIVLRAYCVPNEAEAKGHEASFPRLVAADTMFGRAILAREPVQLPDVAADQAYALREGTLRGAVRAQAAVPLMRDGEAIGAINMTRRQTGEFSQAQIELLQVFANQAVIAITSAETYRALQTRTSDLQQTLEYQTATSDVLKVISRSTFDLQPVLDTVVETAARLCNAEMASISRREGNLFRPAAYLGFPPEFIAERETRGAFDLGNTVSGRAAREGRVIHVHDVAQEPDYPEEPIRLGKQRSSLGVPLLRDDEVIGVMILARRRVEPFTDQQIELVRTFADQAVIAIENTRLITEQREALEQQTAMAEVLQVINASPGNLTPVFDTVLQRVTRLCDAAFGIANTYDGERFRTAALHRVPAALAELWLSAAAPPPGPNSPLTRIASGEDIIHIEDFAATPTYRTGEPRHRATVELGGARSYVAVALRRQDGALLGTLAAYRQEVRPFSDKEIALLKSFAAQAVIAIENARLITETREALEQQTATAEVLQVINANPGNLTPVFDAILDKAHTLCGAAIGSLVLFDGAYFRAVATHGWPNSITALFSEPAGPNRARQRLVDGERFVQVADIRAIGRGPNSAWGDAVVESTDARTMLLVPLRKDGALLGFISAFRPEVRVFSVKEIALLENFAAQAVIAMENARLLTETREALEQQTATAEVLQVINASPGDLAPVFDAVLDKALRLCDANFGQLITFDGVGFRTAAWQGLPPDPDRPGATTPPTPGMALYRLIHGEEVVHVPDITADEVYRSGNPTRRRLADEFGGRTAIWVALKKDTALLGAFVIYRTEVRPFSHKQIVLLQNFAAQAVIAMENARLLDEIRQRQEELRVTFENMGDGVAMFDETQHLVAWNRKFQDILDVPDDIIARRQTFPEYLRYLAERGEYGPGNDPEEHVRGLIEQAGQSRTYERTRPDGRVIEIRHNPVPGGGFVLIYADITERKRNEAEIRAARDAAEEASRTIEAAYRELKTAQANLIQAEKMASLGQLTAGIAHEIKNPLNFVNNFAALSVDLLSELKETAAPGFAALTDKQRAEIDEVSVMLTSNLEKINEHGRRADGIVKAMLEHSRGSSGERRMVDLNALIDEALNLAYHGARAQDQSFNITLEREFGEGIASIEVNPQDITRVFLNIFSNGFYAVTRRARDGGGAGFVPTLKVTTIDAGEAVEIRVRDNGIGIPVDIRDKLFQPFFTTKPTGEGTGLGLSITYDIVTQQHGGNIAVDSKVGEYSEFTIQLPRNRP